MTATFAEVAAIARGFGRALAWAVECLALGSLASAYTAGMVWIAPLHGPLGLLIALSIGNACAFATAFAVVWTRLAIRQHLKESER